LVFENGRVPIGAENTFNELTSFALQRRNGRFPGSYLLNRGVANEIL